MTAKRRRRSSKKAFSKRLAGLALAAAIVSVPILLWTSNRPAIAGLSIDLPAEPVVEGGIFTVHVRSSKKIKDVNGVFQNHPVDFYPSPADNGASSNESRFSALVGVEYGSTPGPQEMALRVSFADEALDRKAKIEVKAGVFPSEKLKVPPKTIAPGPKERKLIAKDNFFLRKVYSTITKSRFWNPPMQLPVNSEITSVYGSSRIYNGAKHNPHLGTDLRAPTGTKIMAPIAGVVALSRYLFYTGNTVILDHGYGFFTIYGHMSKRNLREGVVAKKGEVLGLSGATGRANGPHLHWAVQLHRTKVDPMVVMKDLKND